jgi:hypothetical protein
MYFFLDESGDLGFKEGSSKFLIITLVGCKDTSELARVIKKVRQKKLKKRMKETAELKGHNSSNEVRFAVLKRIANLDLQIHYAVLNKDNVYDYLANEKDKLYNWIAGIITTASIFGHREVLLTVDRRSQNIFKMYDFDKYIKYKIRKNYAIAPKIDIKHRHSHACPELNAIDFVVWGIQRKYEYGDERFYEIIKDKILNKEMVFFKK